jgi:hypothetical protein
VIGVGDRIISDAPASRVHWAVLVKRDAQHDGYTVLADDTGGRGPRRQQYEQTVGDLVRSRPTSTATARPGALPWALVAPVDTDAGQRTALVMVEWPPDEVRDSSGRRTVQVRYFDFDSADLARQSVGFLSLYDAYAAMVPENGTELFFAAEPADPAELASFVIELGPRTLAGIAALLLDGEVIIQPDPAWGDLRARLHCLDAALALLPYGIRTSISAATWTPNDTPHGFRVAFSSRPVSDQRGVSRGQNPQFRSATGPDYLDRIMRYIDSGGTQAVERLVKRLWDDRDRYSAHRTEQVLQAVADLDHVYAVYQDLNRGTKTVDDVVRLLRRPDVDLAQAEPEEVDRLVQTVIDQAEMPKLSVLSRHWSTPSMPSMVVEAVLTASPPRARALWEAARKAGAEAAFVVALVQQVTDNELDHLANLMARRPVPDLPELGAVLLARPGLVFRLLTITFVEDRRDRLGEWAELAFGNRNRGDLPLWAQPFAAMWSGRSELTLDQLTDRMLKKIPAMPALLALAAGSSGAGTFLECFLAWQALLNQLWRRNEIQVGVFADVADTIRRLAPPSQAGLDLLRVAAGRRPARLPAEMDQASRAPYLRGLQDRFARLNPTPVLQLSTDLAVALVPARLARSGAAFLLDLADAVYETSGTEAEGVYRHLGRLAVDDPDALHGQPERTLQRLTELVPELGARLARHQLSEAAAMGWPMDRVIALCGDVYRTGRTVIEILEGLGVWPELDNPAATYRLIEALWLQAGAPSEPSDDRVLRPGIAYVLEGGCGVTRAQNMSSYLVQMAGWHRGQAAFMQRTVKDHKPPKRGPRRGEPLEPENSDPRENSERSQ